MHSVLSSELSHRRDARTVRSLPRVSDERKECALIKKVAPIFGALMIMALGLSACTGAAPSERVGTLETTASELQKVRVAATPITDTGAIWAAIDEGIFAEHGLDVEVVTSQGGAQAVPALLSGDVQFAIGQPFASFRADLQDLGVVVISNYSSSRTDGPDMNAVVSREGAGISRPAHLAGKRVSVNSLGAAGDVTIMKAVQDDGGDPRDVEFVEVQFSDIPAQLEAKNIDAAWAPDPFMSQVLNAGGEVVMYPYQETVPGVAIAVTFTVEEVLENDPDLVRSFSNAMREALAWAEQNDEAVRAALVTHAEMPEEIASSVILGEFTDQINVEALEELAELAVIFGVLDAKPDFSRLVKQQ